MLNLKISSAHARELLKTAEEICPATQVDEAVSRIAKEMNAVLADANPLVMVVMRGAVVFAGQLLPQLTFPLNVDSIDATRYGDATRGGEISFHAMPISEIAGRTVLLVDDILDEGITLKAIRDKLLAMKAQKVVIAVFADKQTGKTKPLAADFVGVTLPNRYVFGFGMDVHGYWRNLPSIYAVKEQE
jgi:hypoxanthine phosphoribosyltransferase